MGRTRLARLNRQRRKATGSHYTPAALADYLADQLIARIAGPLPQELRVLDPACGNGALLDAMVRKLADAGLLRGTTCEAVGIDEDDEAQQSAGIRLAEYPHVQSRFVTGNYLELSAGPVDHRNLLDAAEGKSEWVECFDVVIANPPYVRTQVLGSRRAQELASHFGLRGRVDLYHAFLVAITASLRPGGLLGIITSNRFLTTLSGAAVREYLVQHYIVEEIIDLGDSKLFEAAVLPAIVIGRKRQPGTGRRTKQRTRFTRLYSASSSDRPEPETVAVADSVVDILTQMESGWYRAGNDVFRLSRGDLEIDRFPGEIWQLTTHVESGWLSRLQRAAHGTFDDVAFVRVGIKTTADEIFIRPEWDDLPEYMQPEPRLLKPILSHEDVRQWALPNSSHPQKKILYPHEVRGGKRTAVNLRDYPKALAYLESHRTRLERRHYVIEAGRNWYEIWVPQDPNGWSAPKIVFPDISPGPRFFLDDRGFLVDGDCYWITLKPGVADDLIYLLLGIANSALCERFHDLAFNNRLYSGRRRYITQYVKKYPLPDVNSVASRELIAMVKRICRVARESNAALDNNLAVAINRAVYAAFDMQPEGGIGE